MNVTNLPIKERIKLFKEWRSKVLDHDIRNSMPLNEYFGNDIDFTKNQMSNPKYIIPEWNGPLPEWCFTEKLSERIVYTVNNGHETGIFLGLSADYTDFYYRVKVDGKIQYWTCVGGVEFLGKEKKNNKSYNIVEVSNDSWIK